MPTLEELRAALREGRSPAKKPVKKVFNGNIEGIKSLWESRAVVFPPSTTTGDLFKKEYLGDFDLSDPPPPGGVWGWAYEPPEHSAFDPSAVGLYGITYRESKDAGESMKTWMLTIAEDLIKTGGVMAFRSRILKMLNVEDRYWEGDSITNLWEAIRDDYRSRHGITS